MNILERSVQPWLVDKLLGKFEKPLLIAIDDLKEDAYAQALTDHLEVVLKRDVSIGQTSRSLSALSEMGLVERHTVKPVKPQRGQRSRYVYTLTNDGTSVLSGIPAQAEPQRNYKGAANVATA